MLVAGGGSGGFASAGSAGGGGGAGGVVKHTGPTLNFPAGTWVVTLGNGGTSTNSVSNNGENSSLVIAGVTSITAYGGGKGGTTGEPGGSGGGSTSSGSGAQRPGGTGVSGQGNPGGTAPSPNVTISSIGGVIGGGGGGSASAGGNGSYSGSSAPSRDLFVKAAKSCSSKTSELWPLAPPDSKKNVVFELLNFV